MPPHPASPAVRSGEADRRGGVYDALVGRRIDRGFSIVIAVLNLAGFAGCSLAFLFFLLGAAMAAGTATPAMDRWLERTLWSLGIGAAACLYTAAMLAARQRWPRGVQLLALLAIVAFALLNLFAPPGIWTPRPDA